MLPSLKIGSLEIEVKVKPSENTIVANESTKVKSLANYEAKDNYNMRAAMIHVIGKKTV